MRLLFTTQGRVSGCFIKDIILHNSRAMKWQRVLTVFMGEEQNRHSVGLKPSAKW